MKNYKEKYEQAIENLKKIKNANRDNKELVDFIEYQYPELKESEDEGIRKTLIEFVKEYGDKFYGQIAKMSAIAWLEKQGEQKADKCEGCNNVKGCITCIDGDQYAHIKEYNPAWSEEDEKMFIGIISIVGDWYNSMSEKEKEYYGDCGYINWFKSLKERVQAQLKQEWTGYDEKAYEIALLDIDKSPSITKNDTIDWLKSLKNRVQPQPKQEWSEEDERIFTLCASSVRTRYTDGLLTYEEYKQAILWLKSLKERMKEE